MKIAPFFVLMLLCSCANRIIPVNPTPPVVVQTEYVIKLPPAQDLTLPPPVPNIDVDTATQADVAAWLLAKEQYTLTLKEMLKNIAQFFSDQQAELNK